ncbi:TraR/DksA family transcriptional regulator [Nocardioides sediminis]|uniref:TraR/DksA family transcriptional regulator n=1 Tax=Nocardioides sediminis TaxID=433648 RepID=UPI000D318992|nr:TraR/DksA C4-type zinc finger protein [Nocardioides sediminis]
MASSTRKSLAGSAAAAAKTVIGRRSAAKTRSDGAAAPAEKPAARTTAKKAPAKKAAAKKAPAKKAPAKKTAVKKTAAATAPAAKKTATKKATTKAPATKAPATKTTPKKTTAKKTATTAPATRTSAQTTSAQKTTAKTSTTKKAAVKKTAPAKAPAKKTAKKAPMSALVVKEGEGDWTKAELDEVLSELHTQRDKLVHVLDEAEHDLAGLMRDAGDGAGHDQADMGATSFERDHELTVLNNEREMLAQIDRALGHIHDGSYGVCESCGQPIGKMRLMAFPRATLCMTCKQREERR